MIVGCENQIYKSSKEVSLVRKLFWSASNKTILILLTHFFIYQITKTIFSYGGFFNLIWMMLITSTIQGTMIKLINFPRLFKMFGRRNLTVKKIKKLSQKEVNLKAEYHTVDLNQRFMEANLIWFKCLIIAPIFPYAPLIGIICLCLNYWIDKYYFLNGCKIIENNSKKIFIYSLNCLPYSIHILYLIQIFEVIIWMFMVSSTKKMMALQHLISWLL